jgi:prepilin-type N-terminal cleavage/methylation domain-containing protein
MDLRNKNKNSKGSASASRERDGFTLIELLVVVAIIGLLSSIALIALISARQKSRDVKRLSDMTQMNTALELYYAANKGYPAATNYPQVTSGIPADMIPTTLSNLPNAPMPPDGACEGQTHPAPVMGGIPANTYFYYPSGTPVTISGKNVYPDYAYYFCLGNETGQFSAGPRIVSPKGVR